MQVDLMIGSSRWSDSAALARSVEAAGLSGMVFTETGQTPWLNIAAAAVAAPSLTHVEPKPWASRYDERRWRADDGNRTSVLSLASQGCRAFISP